MNVLWSLWIVYGQRERYNRPTLTSSSALYQIRKICGRLKLSETQLCQYTVTGASIPSETMLHFPLLFQIPPIFEKFPDSEENFQNLTFLVIDHKFRISPYFRCCSTFPSLFRENYYSPLLWQIFSPCFTQIHLLFTYFMCISFPPYFDHDAFMHHLMHVLDAPVSIHLALT